MQFLKITCSKCLRRDLCSSKTRMYVNYCGSRSKNIEPSIKEAVSECRSRRGYMLFNVISPASIGSKTPDVINLFPSHS
jgi:hypothetical protein